MIYIYYKVLLKILQEILQLEFYNYKTNKILGQWEGFDLDAYNQPISGNSGGLGYWFSSVHSGVSSTGPD